MDFDRLATQVLEGARISRLEAQAILDSSDDELPALLDAAERLRRHAHGV